LVLVPLERVYATNAWLAGQYAAHLCAASILRAMPETEIPPRFTGGYLLYVAINLDLYFITHNIRRRVIIYKV
jgi:hypothetical protein